MTNPEYASQGFVVYVWIWAMTLVFIVPVVYKYRPAGGNPEIDPLRPEIIGIDKIFAVTRRIARPGTLGDVHVDPEAVDVVHKNRIPIDAPMLIAQVEHRSGMGMPATGGGRPEVAGMRPLVAQPVHVIGDGLDIVVGIGIEVFAALPMVPRSLYHMEEMRDNAYRGKRMPIVVEIDTPRVTRAVREDLKYVACRMITPYARVNRCPFVV